MQPRSPLLRILFRVCVRLCLGLALLVGLCGTLAGVSLHAHAAPAATMTVTDCSGETGTGRIGTVISSASAGDTIMFSCSGTIPLSSTLTISKNLTLDGSGQTVTLDGGNSVRVLFVNSGVTFTLNALTIAHGRPHNQENGGGLLNETGSTVSISNSTFANNSANSFGIGGGLYNHGGTVSISNSTFANNVAPTGGFGGGLQNDGTMSISNSTFANNSAPTGGGLSNNIHTLTIRGSIVANNTGGNCRGGTLTDQGYNLSSDSSCGFTGTGSLQNTDPKLDPNGLQNNGGPTQTIALQSGSPAIDHIPAASCPATDQRGVTRPDDGETTCDIGAYEFVDPPPDSDLGLTNVPANITVDATSPQGAVVTYTPPTVVDEDSPLPSVSCVPASGSTFAIGTTKVTCTVSDSDDANSPVSASFTVTVNDTDLALINVPANITVDATSPQGAVVTYTTPTVVDEDSPLPTATCTPASGSTFPIGTTTVTCTVSDSDDTPSSVSQSFTVTVKGAAAQVNDLISLVNSMGLSKSLQTALDNKLQDVLTAINAGQTATACSELTDFIGFVQSHIGKGITQSQANQLIAAAKQVQAVLGC
jgi:HYR domain